MQTRDQQAAEDILPSLGGILGDLLENKNNLGKGGSDGLLNQGGNNVVSGVFDSLACVVSSVIGGGNPNCEGHGKGEQHDHDTKYTYTYTYMWTGHDELDVKIHLDKGGDCKYTVHADKKNFQEVIRKRAVDCLAKHR